MLSEIGWALPTNLQVVDAHLAEKATAERHRRMHPSQDDATDQDEPRVCKNCLLKENI